MPTIKVVKNDNFTVVANYHLKDKRLSLRAKGVMTLMLSLPEEWDFSVRGLSLLSDDGYQSTAKALKELEDCGYLIRETVREGGRFSDVSYSLYEEPQTENAKKQPLNEGKQPETDSPITEKPITVTPITVKPQTVTPQSVSPQSVKQTNKILNNKILNNQVLRDNESAGAPAHARVREEDPALRPTSTSGTTTPHGHAREEPMPGELRTSHPEASGFAPPSRDELSEYITANGFHVNPDRFLSHYESNGWMVGRTKMKSWKAAVRTWEHNGLDKPKTGAPPQPQLASSFSTDEFFDAALQASLGDHKNK